MSVHSETKKTLKLGPFKEENDFENRLFKREKKVSLKPLGTILLWCVEGLKRGQHCTEGCQPLGIMCLIVLEILHEE